MRPGHFLQIANWIFEIITFVVEYHRDWAEGNVQNFEQSMCPYKENSIILIN